MKVVIEFIVAVATYLLPFFILKVAFDVHPFVIIASMTCGVAWISFFAFVKDYMDGSDHE